MNVTERHVSIFRDSFDTIPVRALTPAEAVDLIRSDRFKADIERLRGCLASDDRAAYDEGKKRLPAVTWSGTFKERSKAGLIDPSGLVVIDLDHVGDRMTAVRAALVSDPAVVVCFTSPSGDGIKAVSAVSNTSDHARAWRAVADRVKAETGIEPDPSGKDVSRLCFLSHDPNAHHNPAPVPVDVPAEAPKSEQPRPPAVASNVNATQAERYARSALEKACEAVRKATYNGGAHTALLKESHAIGGLLHLGVYSLEEAHRSIVEAAISAGYPDHEAARVARDGLNEGEKKPREIPDNSEGAEKMIVELAKLSPVEYEQRRQETADTLHIRVSVLDKMVEGARKEHGEGKKPALFKDVVPWDEPVNAVDVLDELFNIFRRYVIADIETLHAATLWAAFTWFIDHATVAPLFLITAPEKGCGKTVLLSVIGKVSRKPLPTSNISPAAMFRTIEKWGPTLLIDETDASVKDNEELRGILNAGHTRDTAFVIRTQGDDFEPVTFSVWGCKALAGIGTLAETIMSRSIIATMRRKTAGERVENLRRADPEPFNVITRKLSRWAADKGVSFEKHRPANDELTNRTADNWEPLFSVADIAGGEWPALARTAARKLTGIDKEAPSLNEELLHDIRDVFEKKGATRLASRDLLKALNEDDMRPWGTFNRGRELTPRQLARRLEGFGIHPKPLRMGNVNPDRGYDIVDFQEVFIRYLPGNGVLSVTPLQRCNDEGSGLFASVTTPECVTDNKTSRTAPGADCNGVTDKTVVSGKEKVSGRVDEWCEI